MPRIERLQQNTPQWHRWRQQGLGASDAPVIMGEAAFKTPRKILFLAEIPKGATGKLQRIGLAQKLGLA